jgi:Fe-S-cluster-containing hydrogenase component 2
MKRQIIHIDESKCDGCGRCVVACAEGAIRLVDGKARVVKEQYCDGLGDCVGHCPTGALTVEVRDAADFDVAATRDHVSHTLGADGVARLEAAAARHAVVTAPEEHPHHEGGCPGSRSRTLTQGAGGVAPRPTTGDLPPKIQPSDLAQWPVQLHLVSPQAPFFKGKELVVMNSCGALASADIHWRFLRGRSVVMGCPKLDDTSPYARKLAAILSEPSIPKVLVVRMQVPCCGGLTALATEAVRMTGRADLELVEVTLALTGEVVGERTIPVALAPERARLQVL